MLCPTREMLAASSAWGNDVFWYFFIATPIRSVNMEDMAYWGAFHGAEVPFVFGDQSCDAGMRPVPFFFLFCAN